MVTKYKFTEQAKKTRYCEFCGKKLSRYEMVLCEQCLRMAVSILKHDK